MTYTLGIKHFVPPDGNPFNTDRIQISGGTRRTEEDSGRANYAIPVQRLLICNGQVVDINTMLMCSMCGTWKLDEKFYQDSSRAIRRGRRYYCMDCMDSASMAGLGAKIEGETIIYKGAKKQRKKRRKH